MIENWHKLNSEDLGDYAIFSLRRDVSRSPRTGREHRFFVLDAPDWINVVALTADSEVVLIRQFRHGTEEVTLEIPGGMVDREDGDPAIAAARELQEETGYAAEEFIHIGSVTPNPAFLNNRCHTYLALNAHKVGEPQFDGSEDISFELVDIAAVPQLITSGQITHALVIAAFYHYEHFRPRHP